jgi:hypothetical protein
MIGIDLTIGVKIKLVLPVARDSFGRGECPANRVSPLRKITSCRHVDFAIGIPLPAGAILGVGVHRPHEVFTAAAVRATVHGRGHTDRADPLILLDLRRAVATRIRQCGRHHVRPDSVLPLVGGTGTRAKVHRAAVAARCRPRGTSALGIKRLGNAVAGTLDLHELHPLPDRVGSLVGQLSEVGQVGQVGGAFFRALRLETVHRKTQCAYR